MPTPPSGYRTLSPYLVLEEVDGIVEFVRAVFRGRERLRVHREDGSIQHVEIEIGDSVLMMGSSMEGFPPMENMIHVYIQDVDDVFRRALESGALGIMEPEDRPHGDRSGGFTDPQGNIWWISEQITEE